MLELRYPMTQFSIKRHIPVIVRGALQYRNSTLFNTIQANNKSFKSKEFVNRYVLSLVLNTVTDDDSLMSKGNLFHNSGAATE